MTSKENLAETIKKSRPKAKESTIKMYVSNLMKLMKMFEADDLKFLKKPEEVSSKLSDLHYTTQRNYYNSVIVYLMSVDKDDTLIEKYNSMRDDLNKKYEDQQATGVISDKQKENFVDISEVNKMIAEMAKEIKDKNIKKKEELSAKEKALLQVYIIFNIYTRIPLRNDISGMETINKRAYNKLSESEKKERNHLVINKNQMFFELNKFKTSARYESIKIDIPKDLEKLLRIYIRINGMGVLFKTSTGKPLSRNALSQLLIKTSKARMNGKSISSQMLRKIYLSSKYSDIKEEMIADSKIMGHSVAMQQSVYVKKPQKEKKKKEEVEEEEDI
tara:strand:- start:922 stop:1917 length:996 start_codon:yes stop_codon:yes gene_type:complete